MLTNGNILTAKIWLLDHECTPKKLYFKVYANMSMENCVKVHINNTRYNQEHV